MDAYEEIEVLEMPSEQTGRVVETDLASFDATQRHDSR